MNARIAAIAFFCITGLMAGQILPQIAPAELIVETLPRASVSLDGAHLGDAPANGVFLMHGPKPGPHVLQVILSNSHPFSQKIVVVAGKTLRVRAELAPYTGDFEILTTANAEVLIDGKPAGVAGGIGSLLIRGLSTEQHTLRVSRTGYNSEERKIQPAPGLLTTLTIELKAIEATDDGAAGSPPEYVPVRRIIAQGSESAKVFFLPDNVRLVSTQFGSDGNITQWDPASGRQLGIVKVEATFGINAVSPDLKWAAVRYLDDGEKTKLVEAATGRVVWRCPGYAIAFTSDSKRLIVHADDESNTVVVRDVQTGKTLQTWHDVEGRIAFDGTRAAIGGKSAGIRDTQTGNTIHSLTAKDCCFGASFSADGRWLAVTVLPDRKKIELWEVATGKSGRTIDGANASDPNIQFSETVFASDSRHLITLDDHALRIWDSLSGREVRKMPIEGFYGGIALSPDGRWLAAPGQQISGGGREIIIMRRKD